MTTAMIEISRGRPGSSGARIDGLGLRAQAPEAIAFVGDGVVHRMGTRPRAEKETRRRRRERRNPIYRKNARNATVLPMLKAGDPRLRDRRGGPFLANWNGLHPWETVRPEFARPSAKNQPPGRPQRQQDAGKSWPFMLASTNFSRKKTKLYRPVRNAQEIRFQSTKPHAKKRKIAFSQDRRGRL